MPIDIDGFAVLGAIARSPRVFPAISADIVKTAKAFVGKQIKDKTTDLPSFRAVSDAIGPEAMELIVDGLSDAEVKSLLGKFDKQNAAIKAASATEQRGVLIALARGSVQPAEKQRPAPKAVKAPAAKPAVERSGNSKAMRAKKKV